ncbi:MAG: hypothetical protein A2X36_12150 [Elusimicrobia bacterium GWA2_69_24]|nr:MAG: hypothetical protein A2X36_12150 [Elusimicrobia bacterium GWA2_69_24]HBL18866.1 phosphatidylserine decarboxylase family protein [Elusimicrobiota bacterium]
MKIAVVGWPYIIGGLVFGAIGLAFVRRGMGAGWALAAPGLLFAAFCGYFFRDPERPLPADPARIYSPGDGRVLSVGREAGEGDTIRIFLSIFDVHVQRLPVAGRIEKVEYVPGTFAMAMDKEAKENERNIVTISAEGRGSLVVVEQIAGLIARRIRCWVTAGASGRAGERYGLIQFGSQAAVHLPAGTRSLVKPGDRVVGGITPVAEWTATR